MGTKNRAHGRNFRFLVARCDMRCADDSNTDRIQRASHSAYEGQAPHVIGRAQLGRISLANSDSEARAYLDAAIDAGWRAVAEQTA